MHKPTLLVCCSSCVLAKSSFFYSSILAQLEGVHVVMIWVHCEAHLHLGWLASVSGLDFQLNPLQLFSSKDTTGFKQPERKTTR